MPTFEGGCTCRRIRYRLSSEALVVHCCHCRWCQRESGASFALNAMYESNRVHILGDRPEIIDTPRAAAKGRKSIAAPDCRVAVWSNYAGGGDKFAFVRVGTLDNPDSMPPEIHIFTGSKQPWVVLPPGTPAFVEYYEREKLWSAAALQRRAAWLGL